MMKGGLIGKSGQSTLELLVAIAVITLTMSAVISVSFGNQSISVDTQLSTSAVLKARELAEIAKANARTNFSGLSSSSSNDGAYLLETVVETLSNYEKKVTSRVSWQTDPLRSQKIEFTTIVTDWITLLNEGGGGGLTGQWNNPQTAGQIDLGPGNQGNDLVIKDKTVFVAASASSSAKDDFYSIDVTNINSPVKLASINTGEGLKSFALMGNYVYAAQNDGVSQLQIVNVTNPSGPSLVTSATMQGNSNDGLSVFALDNYAYIGSESSSGAEFQIFDVTDPENPIFKGSKEIGADVNDIYVFRNRAYLATSKSDAEIIILDISNPAAPAQIGKFDGTGGAGFSVFVNGFNTFFAGIGDNFIIFDSVNLNSIVAKGSFNANGSVNDLYIRDYLAFLATSNSNSEFQAVNVTNETSPVLHSSFNFSQVGTGIIYKDNVVYISVRSNDALRIVTSQ
ncbi:MAG: hypothetical protein HYR95_01520 [Candidatus Colwellbacteria bacterium]|nr:hypothetical protein [Candidatus Colwellbacteria bacterium]MBI3274173.1 hypothetical protein [Candidatus Colwellbacteria bacterium]